MAKLVGFLLVVGALAGAATLLPIDGRTVLDRWHAARGPVDFASRSWREVAVASGLQEATRRPGAPQARAPAGQPPQKPVEHHTDADRAALDRLVGERAGQR